MRNLAMYGTLLAVVLTVPTVIDAATGTSVDRVGAGEIAAGDPSLPNVYHVVLDMFQTEMFETQLDDGARELLGGFTYFPDTRTGWGRTHLSMSTLYSTDEWDYEQPLDERMEATYIDDTSAVTQLEKAGYQTTGWVHSISLYGYQSPFDVMHLTKDLPNAVPASKKPGLASTLWIYSELPADASRLLLDDDDLASLEDNAFLPATFTTAGPQTMAAAIDAEADLPARGRYTLIHLMVPHGPFVLDADCQEQPATDPAAQSGCAMKMVDDLLAELERLDRFEDSTIVIHGDHGGNFELRDGELVAVPDDQRESIPWVNARSKPVLLVKPAGVARSVPFEESSYPTELVDVLPTIFDSVGLELDVPPDRTSLLADALPTRPVRYFHFYAINGKGDLEGPIRRYAITEDGMALDEVIDEHG
jgi:hypothetical protein